MAQAQAGASRRRSRSTQQKKNSARPQGSSSKSTKRSTNSSKRTASKTQAKRQTPSKPSPVSVVESTAKDAGKAAGKTAKDAGKTVGRAASKARVPLLAGGAALAGAAGGLAFGAHQARHHKGFGNRHKGFGKVNSDDLAKAAKRVGDFGAQMGHFANELQRAREDSNGHGRSPIEVVLEGLTARRLRG